MKKYILDNFFRPAYFLRVQRARSTVVFPMTVTTKIMARVATSTLARFSSLSKTTFSTSFATLVVFTVVLLIISEKL